MSSGCQGTRTTTGSRYRTNSTGMPRAVCAGIVREPLPKGAGHYREAGSGMREFLGLLSAGVGGSRGLAWAHNPKVAGSNPAPATMNDEGLADAVAATSPFRLPPRDVRPGILQARGQGNRRALGQRGVRDVTS